MKRILIRVRYYEGNVYLATAINHRPLLSAQSESGFVGGARALALRALGPGEHHLRNANREEIATDPAVEPSPRASRGLIETRYFVAERDAEMAAA